MRAFLAIVAKDLVTELRLRQTTPTMFVLALVLVTVFGLAAGDSVRQSTQVATAVLWLAFTFAGLLAVEHAFASERESRTWPALLAAPVGRQTVFLAKCASSATMLAAVQLFTLPVALLFFEYTLAGPVLGLLAVLLLGNVALVVLGTFAGAMLAASRARGSLLTVLVLPLLVPVLIFVTACTAELTARGWSARAEYLMAILATFDLVFSVATTLLAPLVMEP